MDLMFQSNIPKVYLLYAVQQAVFLINRVPTKVLDAKSPHEVLYGKESNLNMIKTFECLCYASNINPHKTKFNPRAYKEIFLGYKQGVKFYITLDLHSKSISVSRNVQFYEL